MPASLYGISEESKAIWVFLEQVDGIFENVSLEMLSKARQMADELQWQVVGLLLGHQCADLYATAIAQGADEVWIASHLLLKEFTLEAYSRVVFQAILQAKPSVFLLGATPNGRDLAGRLAVRFRTGLNADCTNLHIKPEGGLLVSEVSGFGGGVMALIEMREHRPQMATVRPGVFSPQIPDDQRSGKIVPIQVELEQSMIYTRILERQRGTTVDLTRVPVLVVGGRGMGGDFKTLKELAGLVGGEVGATRPPVDEGYIERERQIGQTGVITNPKIALCCGLSGAFHLVVGIEKADTVIAINSDPDAPIFEFSDFCIVEDVNKILPELMAALQAEGGVENA